MPLSTQDGWFVVRKQSGRDDEIWFGRTGELGEWFLDRPVTEIKALGFSLSGKSLIVATSSDATLIRRS